MKKRVKVSVRRVRMEGVPAGGEMKGAAEEINKAR